MNLQKARRSARSAFTLLEVLLVIVILVTLATLVLPNLGGRRKEAKIGTTRLQISTVEQALEMFKNNVGRYPTSDEGLAALNDVDQISDEDQGKRWQGPYLDTRRKLQDAWNNEFHYVCPGENNEDSFDLYSDGPDGEEGTDDDVKNWEDEED